MRVLDVASARDDEPGSPGAGRLAAPAVLTMPVARLGRTDLAALIASCSGRRLLPDSVDSLVDRADGYCHCWPRSSPTPPSLPDAGTVGLVPRTFAALVSRQMTALSPVRCQAAAAIACSDPDWALLSEVTGQPEGVIGLMATGAVGVARQTSNSRAVGAGPNIELALVRQLTTPQVEELAQHVTHLRYRVHAGDPWSRPGRLAAAPPLITDDERPPRFRLEAA